VAIAGPSTNEPIRFDDKLVWRAFCNTGVVTLNYPDPQYGLKVSLRGPDGRAVAKTKLGKGFGTDFENVHNYADAVHGWHMGIVDAQGSYDGRQGALSGPLLPSPKDLFQIEKPGTYVLEIQMQMFRVNKTTNQWSRELLRFSPVRVLVERPPDK